MIKQEYIYFDPQNPEFCKKMVAKYGEDWHIDDFHNDTSDDFLLEGPEPSWISGTQVVAK